MNKPVEIPAAIQLPEQIRLLDENARELVRQGQHHDAERLFEQLLSNAPRHLYALRYLAGRAMERGDLPASQKYVERAIRIAPREPSLHQNLGIILAASGYLEGALRAFDESLKLDPNAMICVLRGDALQALGRKEEALGAYHQAERLAGSLAAVATSTPPNHARKLRRAAFVLTQARRAMLDTALAPLERKYGVEAIERARSAADIMIGGATPHYADPLQRPAFGYVPRLRAQPFFDPREFPALQTLETKTSAIRKELEALLAHPKGITPYVDIPPGQEGPWHELNQSPKWSAFHLMRGGKRIEDNTRRCPETLAAIESFPLVRLAGQAPEAFFSILRPRTQIPPHYGIANYKLAVHLPLIVPSQCAICVGDETRTWEPGTCLVFDDSFEHAAWNRSDELHVVLIFETWHPDLTTAEREVLATTLATIERFNRKYAALNAPVRT